MPEGDRGKDTHSLTCSHFCISIWKEQSDFNFSGTQRVEGETMVTDSKVLGMVCKISALEWKRHWRINAYLGGLNLRGDWVIMMNSDSEKVFIFSSQRSLFLCRGFKYSTPFGVSEKTKNKQWVQKGKDLCTQPQAAVQGWRWWGYCSLPAPSTAKERSPAAGGCPCPGIHRLHVHMRNYLIKQTYELLQQKGHIYWALFWLV